VISFRSTKLLLVLVPLVLPAARPQNDQAPTQTSKSPHVYTNDDLERPDSGYDNGLPPIPGLIKCRNDLECFVQALDQATPAAITRTENVEVGTAVVSSKSAWWTTEFTNDRCTVYFRFEDLVAGINEKAVAGRPKAARDAIEGKLERMKRDFEDVRGQTATCNVAVRDLKALMLSSSWSVMGLGPASNFGKNCSGAGFDTPDSSPSKEKAQSSQDSPPPSN
jgi:hypothetical protein